MSAVPCCSVHMSAAAVSAMLRVQECHPCSFPRSQEAVFPCAFLQPVPRHPPRPVRGPEHRPGEPWCPFLWPSMVHPHVGVQHASATPHLCCCLAVDPPKQSPFHAVATRNPPIVSKSMHTLPIIMQGVEEVVEDDEETQRKVESHARSFLTSRFVDKLESRKVGFFVTAFPSQGYIPTGPTDVHACSPAHGSQGCACAFGLLMCAHDGGPQLLSPSAERLHLRCCSYRCPTRSRSCASQRTMTPLVGCAWRMGRHGNEHIVVRVCLSLVRRCHEHTSQGLANLCGRVRPHKDC